MKDEATTADTIGGFEAALDVLAQLINHGIDQAERLSISTNDQATEWTDRVDGWITTRHRLRPTDRDQIAQVLNVEARWLTQTSAPLD